MYFERPYFLQEELDGSSTLVQGRHIKLILNHEAVNPRPTEAKKHQPGTQKMQKIEKTDFLNFFRAHLTFGCPREMHLMFILFSETHLMGRKWACVLLMRRKRKY